MTLMVIIRGRNEAGINSVVDRYHQRFQFTIA
jgi:hypothetical protein